MEKTVEYLKHEISVIEGLLALSRQSPSFFKTEQMKNDLNGLYKELAEKESQNRTEVDH